MSGQFESHPSAAPPMCVGLAADVAIVVVSYECRDDLELCLRSIDEHRGDSAVDVYVIDNCSSDGTQEMVTEHFSHVTLIANDCNVGFATANNQALHDVRSRFVFLLNPDAVLMLGALGELVAFMDSHPEVGAVGPKLLNRDGSLQHSIRRFPSLTSAAFEALFLHRLIPGLTSRFGEVVLNEAEYDRAHPVEWVSGAAMFVRSEVLDRVGLLDESFFLFAEEVDWFKRMHDARVPVWFVPDAVVQHRDSAGGVNPNLVGQSLWARRQYWAKHAGLFRASAAHGLLVVFVVLRVVLWGLLALGGSASAKKQYRAYRRGFRDMLAGRSLSPDWGE
jgi:N-acetylglucosaminyl-diphospho-decaprenol L-rhamnosyltransferase